MERSRARSGVLTNRQVHTEAGKEIRAAVSQGAAPARGHHLAVVVAAAAARAVTKIVLRRTIQRDPDQHRRNHESSSKVGMSRDDWVIGLIESY
jgi:transcriptional/translational regulatory protein YebC/TACO1